MIHYRFIDPWFSVLREDQFEGDQSLAPTDLDTVADQSFYNQCFTLRRRGWIHP